LGVRDAGIRLQARAADERRTARVGDKGDWRARASRRHPLYRFIAEDAVGKDYAAAAARTRHQRRREGRRHYAGGFFGDCEIARVGGVARAHFRLGSLAAGFRESDKSNVAARRTVDSNAVWHFLLMFPSV